MRVSAFAAIGSAVFLLHSTLPAAADQAGAEQLQASIRRHLGPAQGIVVVVPQGNDYAITVDPAALLAKALPQLNAKVSPITLRAAKSENATWQLSADGTFHFSLSPSASEGLSLNIASYSWSGSYDENLKGMISSRFDVKDIVFDFTAHNQRITSRYGQITGSTTGKADGKGGLDSVTNLESFNYEQSMSGVPELPADAVVTVRSPHSTTSIEMTQVRRHAILDFVAFAFENNFKIKDSPALQAEVKAKLTAAVPLMEMIRVLSTSEKVDVSTPMGLFSADEVFLGTDFRPLARAGWAQLATEVKGLKIPAQLLPPSVSTLMVRDFKVDAAVWGFDGEAPWLLAIAAMNPKRLETIANAPEQELLSRFLPSKKLKVTIYPTYAANAATRVDVEGEGEVDIEGNPAGGKVTIKSVGLDDLMEKIKAAGLALPEGEETLAALTIAKGLSKTDASGALLWEVTVSADGKPLVNGIDVSQLR